MTLAILVDPDTRAALASGARVVYSLSGGKDSTAAAHAATVFLDSIGHPRSRRHAVHADLGRIEWPETPATVEAVAERLGVDLIVARNPTHDMISRWERRFELALERYADLRSVNLIGPWSSASNRYCTSELKISPITQTLTQKFPGDTIISVAGLRRQESKGRSGILIGRPDPKLSRKNGTNGRVWHPIADWSVEDVFAYHDVHELPLHVAYTEYGSTRLSCALCVLASNGDIAAAVSAPGNHATYRHLVGMELRSTFSFRPNNWLADVAPDLGSHGAAAIAEAKRRAAERLMLEARIPRAYRYAPDWPSTIPSIEEAALILDVRRQIAGHHDIILAHDTPTAVRDRFAELNQCRKVPANDTGPALAATA